MAFSWLSIYEEVPVILITAALDVPDKALPVFAQFTVTQTLKLEHSALLSRLSVPLFAPDSSELLTIDMRREGKLLQRWRYRPSLTNQVFEANLRFDPPLYADGNLEIVFSGRQISHDFKHLAPRLFVETANANYPDGNYRIASNEKGGDVAMTFYSVQSRLGLLVNLWREQPFLVIARTTKWLLLVLTLVGLPWVIYRKETQGQQHCHDSSHKH